MNFTKMIGFAIGPFMAAGLGLITVPLMAWIFPAEVIGQIAMFNTFLAGSALILTLGLDQAYVREYHEVENKPQLLCTLMTLSLFVVSFFVLVLLCFDQYIVNVLFARQSEVLLSAAGLALAVVASIIYRFLSLILRMQEQGLKFSILQISAKLTLVIALLSLLILEGRYGFLIAFSLSCLSLVIALLVALFLTRVECLLAMRSSYNKEISKQALKFGLPLVASGFAYWGLISIDRWAIRYFVGLEQLGVYSVAFSFAAVMTIFQQVFSTIWAPIVYQWHKKGVDIAQFSLVTDWVVIVLSCVFFIVCLFSPVITFFLPVAFHDVVYLLPACMLYPLFYTLSETTVVGMSIAKKTGYSIVVTLAPLALNLLLCYLLVPKYLAGGAAVAVAGAFALYLILRTEVSKRVWRHFNTKALYLVAMVLLLNAAWPALTYSLIPWYINIISLIVIMFIYRHRFTAIKQDFKLLNS